MKKTNLTRKTLIDVIKNNIGATIGLIIIIIAVVLLSLVPPQILKIIIDTKLVTKNADGLMLLAGAYIGVLILIGIFDFLKGGILTVFGQKIVKQMRKEMFLKLERVQTTFLSANSSGVITSRFTNDVDNVNSLFADGLISMIIDCLKIIGIIASIWMFGTGLGILTLCLVPIIYGLTKVFQKRMLAAQIENLKQLGNVNNHISESLKNVHMIKAYSKEYYMESVFCKRLKNNYETINQVNFYDAIYAPIIQVFRAFVVTIIVIMASENGTLLGISIGMVAASIELITNLFSPIETLGMELQNVQKGLSGIKRVNDFYLEQEDDCKNSNLKLEDILSDGKNVTIVFDNLSFFYEESNPILVDMKLELKAQTFTTFVGRTGVGKSTLFKLVMGLLKPNSGAILVNGIDVYTIPNELKRRIFGYVEQSFSFVKGTIEEQISLGDKRITREQVEQVMKFVGLHEYVMNMESAYDTIVTDETAFSQGQKQLLSIARAIVLKPAVLLLDEITANLDLVTENHVLTILQKAEKERTILSISHRITSMTNGGRIVILENGNISQVGTLEELVKENKWFKRHQELEKNTWGKPVHFD